jgi:apolipoprotein D and lipocalin family protein
MNFLMFFLVAMAASAPKQPEMKPARTLDLPRFMGDWRVIANIPYWAEKDCYGSIERYELLADGRIATTFLARRGGFDGKLVEAKNITKVNDPGVNGDWQVMFLGGWIQFRLIVVDFAPDYSWAALATPDRKLAWVFSRTPTMEKADYQRAVDALVRVGVDPAKLAMVPQR